MTTNLASDLNRFCGHAQRLQQILEETKRCFDDINNSGRFDGAHLINAELLQEEEAEIISTANKPPGIVVFGQNAYVKCRITNEIFGRKILPDLVVSDHDSSYRMVYFRHGDTLSISLALPDDYGLVDHLEAYNAPWNTVPQKDIEVQEDEKEDLARGTAVLEVSINHSLLHLGGQVIVSPSNHGGKLEEIIRKCTENVSPILVYAFQTETLSAQEEQELTALKTITHYQPMIFVRVPPPGVRNIDTDPPDGAPDLNKKRKEKESNCEQETFDGWFSPNLRTSNPQRDEKDMRVPATPIFKQLCDLDFFAHSPGDQNLRNAISADYYVVDNQLIENFEEFPQTFASFAHQTLQRYLINSATVLNNSHVRCLNMFILSAFDMAREMLITPKKLKFAQEKEEELFVSLMQMAVSNLDYMKASITETIENIHDSLVQKAIDYEFLGVDLAEDGEILTAKGLKICTWQIKELMLGALNQAIAGKIVSTIIKLRDSYTGTLTRCLTSLEAIDQDSVDDTPSPTTEALKQILNAAYQVEISGNSSSSLLRILLEKMKQMMQSMPWSSTPKIDAEWKKRIASQMIKSLSEARLAKSISTQIKDRLNRSHESFTIALRQLEQKHSGRLDKIEEERLRLRKVHAPRVAKVALESTSLKDVIQYGTPKLGKEIGRGMYGVVYACDKWSSYGPCAIKNIPEHDRIVALRGSVIDYTYGGGASPAVLLIMDRLQRDLYLAIKQGLEWNSRLQVAHDVVDGIRFLHSQGLVHRDIKLKNVLLDKEHRGKITDLGFCKPEAMISGSIVGTPIHMAPELFTGRYDNSVDVYAFGILFWYVCSGHIKLPSAFEQCANKDHLWQSVKKGLRPEKLPIFDDNCWELMQNCWEESPPKRPLLGEVEQVLRKIHDHYKSNPRPEPSRNQDAKSTSKNIGKIRGRQKMYTNAT
ncbi:hypothetical protein ScPMuIL_009573 [Solemya velum]